MEHSYQGAFGQVELRPLTEEHIEAMRILRNRCRDCFVYSGEISGEEQARWYQKYLKTENDFVFSVFREGTWIGAAALYDFQGTSVEFGRLMIDHEAAGRHGLGVEVTKCACNIAFQQLGVDEIHLVVFRDNTPAVRTYTKAGFAVGREFAENNKAMFLMERRKEE